MQTSNQEETIKIRGRIFTSEELKIGGNNYYSNNEK